MKILISAIHYPVSAARFLADAFRRLGHNVRTLGPAMGGFLPWAPDKDFSAYAWEPYNRVPSPHERIVHLKLNESLCSYDLVVQCDANFFLAADFPCPNVVWAVDNHVQPYNEVPFDLFFGAHSWGFGSDQPNFVWLPCAYDPQAHFPVACEKTVDAVLVGAAYQSRIELVTALVQRGSVLVATGLLGEEYNQACNRARIGLCQSLAGDVPMRVFENAAQGLMLLCDHQRDLGKLGLVDGEHYVGYSTVNEAVGKFQYYRTRPELIAEIAQNGKDVLARHTYEARAQTILDTVKEKFGNASHLQRA